MKKLSELDFYQLKKLRKQIQMEIDGFVWDKPNAHEMYDSLCEKQKKVQAAYELKTPIIEKIDFNL